MSNPGRNDIRLTNSTQTITQQEISQNGDNLENRNSTSTSTYILELQPRRHVTWEENVIDNEHMNKKSSKRCCIFHKVKEFGESSSESEDSEDSISSDSDNDRPQVEGDNQKTCKEDKELENGEKEFDYNEKARRKKEKEKRRREREKRRRLKIHQRNHA